jgi:hypothetical protein
MIHNPNNRSCDSRYGNEGGFKDIYSAISFFYPVNRGKSGILKPAKCANSLKYRGRVNHYIGNMTNPVQPFW